MNLNPTPHRYRLDKWLWAARFFKTRGLANEEISKNRVSVNGQIAKSSREVKVNDRIEFKQAQMPRTVIVKALSDVRGSAPVAQTLYEETAESIEFRAKTAAERQHSADPASGLEQGRPTKRDRRQLAEWTRWSVTADPPADR